MRFSIFFLIMIMILPLAHGQDLQKTDSTKIDLLIKRIEALEDIVLVQKKEDELKKLLDEADQLSNRSKKDEVDISKKFSSGIRQQQGLNPNISVLGDFFGSVSSIDDKPTTEPGDRTHGSNGLYMRSLELSFVAPLDPYARGKAFMDITEDGVSIEELYMELINLPLNMSVKAGVFFPEFGLLNRHHTHALPQFDRPRASVNYFGLDGFNGMGVSVNFLLPTLLFSDASSLDIATINIFDNYSYYSEESVNMAYVGHFKNYYDISDASYFEYTLSAMAGHSDLIDDNNTYMGSFGLHYKWEPPERSKYKSLDIKTELLYGYTETDAGIVRSKGFYSLFHNKLNTRVWIGGRVGYSEIPVDNTQYEWDYTFNVDFWQSEFVFYRIQYQYNDRHINSLPESGAEYRSNHTLVFQFSWAMGPHKHDAY